jgi:hypothetical protein
VHRMKIVISISLFICGLGIIGCAGEGDNTQQSVNEDRSVQMRQGSIGPEILFDTLVNNIGKIYEGEQVICYYNYQNTGDEPLVIHSIKAGCGCTVPEWNDEPLQINEKEDIKVVFNSSGKRGNQKIRITVTSNAGTPVSSLLLTAEVI